MLQFYIMGVYNDVLKESDIPIYIKDIVLAEVKKLREKDEKTAEENEKIAEQQDEEEVDIKSSKK